MVCCGRVWYGMVWYAMVLWGIAWYGMILSYAGYGAVYHGVIEYSILLRQRIFACVAFFFVHQFSVSRVLHGLGVE